MNDSTIISSACGCPCTPDDDTLKLPIRGLCLSVDASCLPSWGNTGQGPELLTKPLDLYVSAASGDDANNGLTPETAFKTVMAAVNKTAGYARSQHVITINVAPGTYTEDVTIDFRHHYQPLIIRGDAAERPVLDGNIYAGFYGTVAFEDIHSKSAGVNFLVSRYAVMYLRRCSAIGYGSAHDAALYAGFCGNMTIDGPVDIDCSSGTNEMIRAYRFGSIEVASNQPVALKGTVRWGTVAAWGQGQVILRNAVLSGTITGPRFNCTMGGLIGVPKGKEATFIPGTTAGVATTNGACLGY